MIIVPVEQNSEAWRYARAGIVTASALDQIVTPKFAAREGKMPESYLYELLAERCMGAPIETGNTWQMEQGAVMEREAREALSWLAFAEDMKVERVGFITTDDGAVGCSPDGLIGEDGGVELKCPQPATHIRYLTTGGVPEAYLTQVHGSMFVTGRKWWNFVSYNRQFPSLVVRVERDERIMAALRAATADFNAKLDAAYASMKALAIGEDERPLPPGRRFRPLVFPI